MREAVRDLDRLLHIQECMNNIQEFVENKTFDEFVADKLLFYAVVKNVEIIGEAAYMLTKEFCAEHPNTPWKDIIGMRHVLVHGYYTTSKNFIWATVQQDLPILRPQIETYIQEEQAKRIKE